MSGFDTSILLGSHGVEVPDPVKQYGTMLTLADLARRSRVGGLEEEELKRKMIAERALDSELPGLAQGNFSVDSVNAAIQRNPSAAAAILKQRDDRLKSEEDRGKTRAETDEKQAQTRKLDMAMVGGLAQSALGGDPATINDRVQTVVGLAKRVNIDPTAFGDWRQDPAAWLKATSAGAMDAAKQIELAQTAARDVETKRNHGATEAQAAATLAETARYHTGELGSQAANRTNQMDIAVMNRGAVDNATAATREATAAQRQIQQTESYSKQLETAMVPQLITGANALDKTINKYMNVRDMPGVGPLDSRMPPMLRSAEGNKVRAQVQAVSNDLLSLYSGKAVTLSEEQRRQVEMMASGNFDETDLRNAWPMIKNRINSYTATIRAGYSTEAVNAFESRGGVKVRPIGEDNDPAREAVKGSAPSGPLTQAPDGSGVDFVYTPGRK